MKTKTLITAYLFSIGAALALTSTLVGQTNNPPDTLQQLVADLQQNPSDLTLREKIIKLTLTLDPAPAIPEEARRHYVIAKTLFNDAMKTEDFGEAVAEFKSALLIAPWWPEANGELGLALKASERYDEAIAALKLYLAAKPGDDKARAIQDEIYILEAKRIKAAKKKKKESEGIVSAEAKAKESSPETIAAKKAKTDADWLKKLDGARYVYLVHLPPPFSSWVGPSGPFVTKAKLVFIIKGEKVWLQHFDLSTNGQILHTWPEEGPHRIEGKQFTSNGKMAVISESGFSIKIEDAVYEREEP
jgi:tetratricopeptide (TPR) repeat protein